MRTILVIDDEPGYLGSIQAALRAKGFHTLGAATTEEGVQLARTHLPDLIVSDVNMVDGDGYQVLASVRADPSTASIPFILMTGRADNSGLRRGMDLGADDYLPKPFSPEALLASVKARLSKAQSVAGRWEKKMDELRESISSSLPHELLTPLTGILGLADVIRGDFDSLRREEVLEMADGIYQSGRRLHRLIENYLFYSQLILWATNPEQIATLRRHKAGQAHELIAAEAQWQAQAHNRAPDLSLALADASLSIKREYVAKVVREVVENAFKFSKTGSSVRVESEVAGGSFSLSCIDGGRGMHPQQVAEIGAYMQFDRELYEQQGSGLGLAIVKLLAELHGGTLSVQSEPGSGTTVRITVPLAKGDAAQVAA